LALQGTLDTFSLPDVLRLLATTSKTGRLRIDGDRGQGSVWLHAGAVVDAAADRAVDGTPTEEVVFELLRFESGSFAFDADDRAVDSASPQAVEDLLHRASSLLREWSELEAVVPSLAHQVSLASDLSSDEVRIDADRWRSVVAVASGRTVGELATTLGLTELGVSRVVRDLVELGVADVGAPDAIPDPPRLTEPEPPRRVPTPDNTGEVRSPVVPEPVEGQRAGWLTADKTSETPVVGADLPSANGTGAVRAVHDEPPAHLSTEPPPGIVPRLRRRNPDTAPPANGAGHAADAPAAPTLRTNDAGRAGADERRPTGRDEPRTPAVPNTGRTPAVPDTGRTPAVRENGRPPTVPDTGRTPVAGGENGHVPPPGPVPPAGPLGSRPSLPGRGRAGEAGGAATTGPAGTGPARRRDPGAPPRRPANPGPSFGGDRSPFDGGLLGPSPLSDTGQIRPVPPSSLPPDLHWAADDITNTGPVSSPFSGLTSLGPPPRPHSESGEVAPHVAAMSPEARAAVQNTVGNGGGSAPGRGAVQGEDIAQRSRLISFLSTVR
jgi:Domain of unknown function (DUF4388)